MEAPVTPTTPTTSPVSAPRLWRLPPPSQRGRPRCSFPGSRPAAGRPRRSLAGRGTAAPPPCRRGPGVLRPGRQARGVARRCVGRGRCWWRHARPARRRARGLRCDRDDAHAPPSWRPPATRASTGNWRRCPADGLALERLVALAARYGCEITGRLGYTRDARLNGVLIFPAVCPRGTAGGGGDAGGEASGTQSSETPARRGAGRRVDHVLAVHGLPAAARAVSVVMRSRSCWKACCSRWPRPRHHRLLRLHGYHGPA